MIAWPFTVSAATFARVVVFAAGHTPVPPPPPPPPLPSLPSVARVSVEVTKDRVVVVEDVNLPRGAWRGGDLELFVAFGAPGVPLAFDAHLLPVADGALEAPADERGEALAVDRAPRRPVAAHAFLGPSLMTGAVLHAKEAMLRRAFAPGSMALVRVRTLLAMPAEDAHGAREVVVRLGQNGGAPLTLGRLLLVAREIKVTSAEAHLCGPDAEAYPLSIAVTPRPPPPEGATARAIAPVLAVRHASDDLCVRFSAP